MPRNLGGVGNFSECQVDAFLGIQTITIKAQLDWAASCDDPVQNYGIYDGRSSSGTQITADASCSATMVYKRQAYIGRDTTDCLFKLYQLGCCSGYYLGIPGTGTTYNLAPLPCENQLATSGGSVNHTVTETSLPWQPPPPAPYGYTGPTYLQTATWTSQMRNYEGKWQVQLGATYFSWMGCIAAFGYNPDNTQPQLYPNCYALISTACQIGLNFVSGWINLDELAGSTQTIKSVGDCVLVNCGKSEGSANIVQIVQFIFS